MKTCRRVLFVHSDAPGNDADLRQAFALVPNIARKEAIDLITMGTLARAGISGLFIGNTAEAILSKVSCSLLAIKPAGFRSAVTLD